MTKRINRRAALASLLVLAALTGCQTVPASPYSRQQVETLESSGFLAQDGNYLLGLENKVLFAFDSSELREDTAVRLVELGRVLSGVGIRSAGVEGHSSGEGDAAHNLKLSEQRAATVRSALVQGGLSDTATRIRGMGALDPIAPNDSEEGRQQNRRVVIIVTPADAIALN